MQAPRDATALASDLVTPSGRAGRFAPIAVVGRACVLPGALSPSQLWAAVASGRDLLTSSPPGRWRLDRDQALCAPEGPSGDRTWSDRGGYVEGFDEFWDPTGFGVADSELEGLDPLVHWVLHTGREALRDARASGGPRVGAIFGNLGFPSERMAAFAESVWMGKGEVDPRNRFMSGGTAELLRRALDLGAGAFSLDAACASSLYAIKLACDRLHDGTADLMLAGAVQRADDLFLHVGFCALNALSRSGRSRPFHRDADGLIPAEGAAFVALKRLEDARRDGDTVHGVIRGVGLSNDGRGKGLLAPAEEGQRRALRAAYQEAGFGPERVSLLECHATGTPVGDATELRSTGAVFEGLEGVPIGSLKSNLGHLITTAGVAALIKVLEAMRARQRPPTLHVEQPTESLRGTPFRLLTQLEPWDSAGPRIAAISAFGFGGNNAHLIVSEDAPAAADAPATADAIPARDRSLPGPIAVVGLGSIVAAAPDRLAFTDALFSGKSLLTESGEGRMGALSLDLDGLRFPPHDLAQTLPQQLAVLQACREALGETGPLPRERTGIFIGMEPDNEVARYGTRWRLARPGAPEGWLAEARDAVVPVLESAAVVGTMPNIPANRLSSQFDLAGPAFTVQAGAASGLVALELAARALRCGELDAALVGAVDLCCEPVQRRASSNSPGDASVVLVLKRLADAESAGDRVYALLTDPSGPADVSMASGAGDPRDGAMSAEGRSEAGSELALGEGGGYHSLLPQVGDSGAASGLVTVAAAALCLHHRSLPGGRPWLSDGPRRAGVRLANGRVLRLGEVRGHDRRGDGIASRLRCFAGADREAVVAALTAGRESVDGPARLVLVADDSNVETVRARALAHLERGAPAGTGIHFFARPVEGQLAFVFAGAGAAYRGMGRELLRQLPRLGDALATRSLLLPRALAWSFDGTDREPTVLEQLWGASALCQLHVELTRGLVGLRPDAWLGYSSGETNALIASGVWTDVDALIEEGEASGIFTRDLGGGFEAVARHWGRPVRWASWTVLAPVAEVEAAVAAVAHVHLAVIHGDEDCVIAGDEAGCDAAVERLGRTRCLRLGYPLAVHVPELTAVRDAWLRLHRRPVSPLVGARIYSNARGAAYEPSEEACATAILEQADRTLDLRPTVLAAWNDGVRIFVEHGPQAACGRWIRNILGDREALVVSLDRKGQGFEATLDALAALLAAGQPVAHQVLDGLLTPAAKAPSSGRSLTFPSHPPGISIPPLPVPREEPIPMSTESPQQMRPAPALAPVLAEDWSFRGPAPGPIGVPEPVTGSARVAARPAPAPATAVKQGLASSPAPAAPLPSAKIGPSQSPAPRFDSTLLVREPDLLVNFQEHVAQLSRIQQDFVRNQQAVHQRFLALREGALSALLAAARHESSPDATSRAAVSPLPASPAAAGKPGDLAPERPSLKTPEAPPRGFDLVHAESPASGVRQAEARLSVTPGASPSFGRVAPEDSRPAGTPDGIRSPERAASAGSAETRAVPATRAPIVDRAPVRQAPATEITRPVPVGRRFSRAELEVHSGGRISEIFGPEFAAQDGYRRQVRMPLPPLLLADRVVGLAAEPASMGKGTIWTETDVRPDSWYLNHGFMPAGVMIEAGQADLMLISYLGVDLLNRGERVYRLLGCELTYHGDLPRTGDTLRFAIHLDGHAAQGDVRLMFFHYTCTNTNGDRPQLSVRKGQAGFFTDAELAASAGCLFRPEEQEIVANPRLDPPAVVGTRARFGKDELLAFAAGKPFACFGAGFERAQTHTRSPGIQGGAMLLQDRVTELDPAGGPWKRGYLRAELDIRPDQWFFDGHFMNDPCMPGTLMFEGCLQALAFYLASRGYTIDRDGWRFQPVPEIPYQLQCRGQVIPTSRQLVTEVFVEEVIAGPIPTVYADLLCTVDGLKAFHARRVALQLVPDWPLGDRTELLESAAADTRPVAVVDGFRFDYKSLLACAWGRPSHAFGPMYERFDGPTRVARLPGPPYHFMSRIREVEGPIGVMKAGAKVVVEYDVPEDVWYFDENGCRTMPFAVLLEAALQPCGWLSSYVGSALTVNAELGFRNLDGKGTVLAELHPHCGTLTTHVELLEVSATGSMIIETFAVRCFLGEQPVYELKTVFGFFPPAALAGQVGLPTNEKHRKLLNRPSDFLVDLTAKPQEFFAPDRPRLAGPMLLMLDRVDGYWPEGGAAGLGQLRAVKDVDADEWFFKAHFFQDPVQPGSLGIEAMIQALQFYMLETGMDRGIPRPRFEGLAVDREHQWKYRGQVLPHHRKVHTTLEVTETGRDDRGVYALATASLWADGQRIYEAVGLGMRIVSDDAHSTADETSNASLVAPKASIVLERSKATPEASSASIVPERSTPAEAIQERSDTVTLDPATDAWLLDHRPTWTVPALPMMCLVDLLARASQGDGPVVGLRDVRVSGWLLVDRRRTLRAERKGETVRLFDGPREVASARVRHGSYGERPAPLPVAVGESAALPYETGALFHGPAFQVMRGLVMGRGESSSILSAESGVPAGLLNPALLDGATHGIPHADLHTWGDEYDPTKVAYPAVIQELELFGPTPKSGTVRCEVRQQRYLGSPDYPVFAIQLVGDDGVWCQLKLVESCFPKGPLGSVAPRDRRAFLRDRAPVAGLRLSRVVNGDTRLTDEDVEATDWLPGTVAGVYGTRVTEEIARREHAGAAHGLHPSRVFEQLPLTRFDLAVERQGSGVRVSGDGRGRLDLSPVREFWTRWFDRGPWPVEDLFYGLIDRFLGRVVIEDPEAFAALKGRSVLYLANHQTGVESLIFSIVASALNEVPTVTLAKIEHRETWLGRLISHCFSYPGVVDPRVMTFFDRENKESLVQIIGELAAEMAGPGRSVMVHVEGTRARSARPRVAKMSGAFIDMALHVGAPIVPIRFAGGLPVAPVETRLEFPFGMGRQDIHLGRPLMPDELRALHYGARKERVIAAINALGVPNELEEPSEGAPLFAARARARQEAQGVSHEHATLHQILTELAQPSTAIATLLAARNAGDLAGDVSPEGQWLAELGRRLLGEP